MPDNPPGDPPDNPPGDSPDTPSGDRLANPPDDADDRAREGYHDPTAGFAGAAPARSALTLRLVLASFGLVICGVAAGLLLSLARPPAAIGAILAFLAAAAIIDIVVVARRKLRGEPG